MLWFLSNISTVKGSCTLQIYPNVEYHCVVVSLFLLKKINKKSLSPEGICPSEGVRDSSYK